MRFVQISDVHLDSSVSGGLRLPPEKRAALRQDAREAFVRACELVKDSKADLLLIPGDLFDYENLSADTGAFLADHLARLAPIPVFIAPGNHDSLRPGNPYLCGSGTIWPSNVHIFTSQQFESVSVSSADCCVTGIGHAHRGIIDRLLARPLDAPNHPISILLFHGSRDGYRPSEKESVIPFSDQELLAQRFTYAAIGHYHGFATIEQEGVVRAAYSGCLQGLGLDEAGSKFALVGETDGTCVTLEPVEVAPRRIARIEAAVTGASDVAAVIARVHEAFDSSGARACDIVAVQLAGALSKSVSLDTTTVEQELDCFHACVDASRVEPDYDLEALARESAATPLRSAFVRRMLQLAAETADENERATLRDATFYGLTALDGGKLEPRDAD